jgi:hypothetical protein
MAGMAAVSNGIGLSSGITNLISFALASCSALTSNIKSFQSKERTVRELRGETQGLELVLRTLQESMGNIDVSMEFLEQPLKRCRDACTDFNTLITKSTEHSADGRVSIGDWLSLQYMGEDIKEFKNTLAGYKATITIALACVNMYEVSASFRAVLTISSQSTKSSRETLDEYKELIEDTRHDLEAHLRDIKDKLQSGITDRQEGSGRGASELRRMEEERDSTQQCLKICAEVYAHIESKARSALPIAITSYASPSAEPRLPFLITAEAFNLAQRNFISSTLHLQQYLHSLNSQVQTTNSSMRHTMADQDIGQQSFEDEVESITDSLSLCDRAANQENEIRRNFYEDISVGDDSQQIIVSLKDLISAKRIIAGSRSTQVMGQVSEASLEGFSRAHYHSGGENNEQRR